MKGDENVFALAEAREAERVTRKGEQLEGQKKKKQIRPFNTFRSVGKETSQSTRVWPFPHFLPIQLEYSAHLRWL